MLSDNLRRTSMVDSATNCCTKQYPLVHSHTGVNWTWSVWITVWIHFWWRVSRMRIWTNAWLTWNALCNQCNFCVHAGIKEASTAARQWCGQRRLRYLGRPYSANTIYRLKWKIHIYSLKFKNCAKEVLLNSTDWWICLSIWIYIFINKPPFNVSTENNP